MLNHKRGFFLNDNELNERKKMFFAGEQDVQWWFKTPRSFGGEVETGRFSPRQKANVTAAEHLKSLLNSE